MRARIVWALALVCLISGATTSASAATITTGAPIPVAVGRFVVPIEVHGAVELTAWQFDLAYDATDVRIHMLCDPFVDAFCSLLTGPVTEGEFFAGGVPFNLLNPGAVLLDGALEQTGVLQAAQGAYGGFPPAPSGDGVLAYVHFITIGTGDSPITVENPSLTEPAAPEPASALLLTTGAALALGRRYRAHRHL